MQVLEEQGVSKLGALMVVRSVAMRHFDFPEENILSNSILIIKVPQNIISDNSRGCWHKSLIRSNCHGNLPFPVWFLQHMAAKIYSVVCCSRKMVSGSKHMHLIDTHGTAKIFKMLT